MDVATDIPDEYSIGECKICKRTTALKNGICVNCTKTSKDIEPPDFFSDLLRGFGL
jgi:hypothetical protein